MRLPSILRTALLVFLASSLFAAPANIQVDTKTHAVSITDGSTVIDAKAITLTVGGFTIYDGAGVKTIALGSTSGVQFGATGNKIAFLGAVPIIRPTGTTDLRLALINLGLYSIGGATPLNLNGGTFTAGVISGSNETLSGTLSVTGNSTFVGTVGITGATSGSSLTLSGNSSVGGMFAVTGASALHAITGTDEALTGTLGVTGNSTLASLAVTNNATVGGTLAIAGIFSGSSIVLSGNEAVAGTFGVNGATTMTSLNAATGIFSDTVSAASYGAVNGTTGIFSSTLGITGALTGSSAAFTGNETIGGTLDVSGLATFGNVSATSGIFVTTFIPPQSTVAGLGSAGTAGRVERLADGPAVGALVVDDGTSWRGLSVQAQKLIVVTEPPYNTPNDNTGNAAPGINAAITDATILHARVLIPNGTYRLTSGITILGGVQVEGVGFATDMAGYTETTATTGPLNGTWLHVTSASFTPVTITPPGQCSLRRLGIIHDQPVPGAGWAPTIYPFAIKLTTADEVFLEDLMLLNPSHGIGQLSGSVGRVTINNLFMHSFVEGLHFENVTDVSRFNNIHFWPFYSIRTELRDYTRANATGIYIKDTQNPQFVNIFGFALNSLFVLDGTTTTKVRIANADADNCNRLALLRGNGSSNWVNVRGGGGTDTGTAIVEVQGVGNNAKFVNLDGDQLPAQLVKVTGHSNDVKIVNGDVYNIGTGVYAIENSPDVVNGNTISIDNVTFAGANSDKKFGGTEPWNINRTNVDGIGTPIRGCNVYHNAAQSVIASGVSQALIFNTNRLDTDGEHSTVSNTDRITFKKAGWRSVQASIEWAADPDGIRELWVEHYNAGNASQGILTDTGRQLSIITAPGTGITMVQSTPARVFYAASGDYIKVWVNQTSGGALNVNYAPKYSPEVTCVWQGM